MVMEVHSISVLSVTQQSEEDMDLRRGPWTVEEDLILMNYISNHGVGRWNSLARGAGLKRTGKSCRLRWLNYLRPDIRRGNITPEEQLIILELHLRWGNRWSKIAQHLPGRTDNEIKNYWRTRVLKHAKQLRCDVNSLHFKDIMRYLWMPRLVERIQAVSGKSPATEYGILAGGYQTIGCGHFEPGPESSGSAGSLSDSTGSTTTVITGFNHAGGDGRQMGGGWWPELAPPSPGFFGYQQGLPELVQYWGGETSENLSMEDIWQQMQ